MSPLNSQRLHPPHRHENVNPSLTSPSPTTTARHAYCPQLKLRNRVQHGRCLSIHTAPAPSPTPSWPRQPHTLYPPLPQRPSSPALLEIPTINIPKPSPPSNTPNFLNRTSSREPPLQNVPRTFHIHYDLMDELGAGEYGRVWRAKHRDTGTVHAVKIIPKERPDRSLADSLRSIECEVSIWQQCMASQFVCQLEAVYQDDESVYLVQELCTGGDLRELVSHGSLSEYHVAEIMRAVLDVVAICHHSHCTFGDIKPANFLLKSPLVPCSVHTSTQDCTAHCTPPVSVRATDFGFSRRSDTSHASHNRLGSPVYMAPELWCHECGPAADMWAAGVMMYQLLSGRYPFWEEDAEAVAHLPLIQVMLAVSSNPIHMRSELWDQVSRPAKDLITAMLDRDSSTRISVDQALSHPWFQLTLGHTPQPTAIQLDATCRKS